MPCSRIFLSVLAGVLIFAAAARQLCAVENEPPATVTSVALGFNGLYKVGAWTPVEVECRVPGGESLRLDVWTEDSDGAPTRFTKALSVDGGREVRKEGLIVKFGRRQGHLRIVLRDGERTLLERSFTRGDRADLPAPIARGEYLVVSVGSCDSLRRTLDEQPQLRALGVRLAELSDHSPLPVSWEAYAGVDFVVLLGSQPATVALLEQPALVDALSRWLCQGGRTIFSLGPEAERISALEASPKYGMQMFAPGKFKRILELRSSASLEVYAGVAEPLLVRGSTSRGRLQVPDFAEVDGAILAFEALAQADLPLVVRQWRSFGEATFVAVDLNEPMLDVWSGTAPLITRLLFPNLADVQSSEIRSGQVSHLGYDDLAGQLRSALGQFDRQGVQFLPFGLFAGLLVFYLLLIGPGDYVFLKRFLPRMEYTWLTFGLILLVFCAGCVWLANWAKGNAWHRNKVDLVDVDLATGFARGRTWFTLFSPQSTQFDLQLQTAAEHASLSWMGLPGAGLGGMESAAAPPLFAEGYDFVPEEPRLNGVPLQVWSTKSFTGTWFPTNNFGLEADLVRVRLGLDDVVEGRVVNLSPNRWNNAVLLFDRWVVPLGTIPAGGTAVIDERTQSMVADQFFTRRKRIGEEDVVTNYDKASLDISRIMEMVLFHQAAGGREYTQLKHHDETRLDFTRLLSPERAILLVQRGEPAVQIEQTNIELAETNSGQWTFLRFIIPVAEQKTDP